MELSEVRQQQAQKARDLRANMGGFQRENISQVQNQGREELARQMSGVRQNFGSRGLLHSGLRKDAESQAAGNIASQGAQQIAQNNVTLSGQLEQAEGSAIQSGLEEQRLRQMKADHAYDIAIGNRANRNALLTSVTGAASQAAGDYAGRQS